MPLLSHEHVADLLKKATRYSHDEFPHGVLDYCRTCDEFYWLNDSTAHRGHRLTLVPFVEDRYA